MRGFNRRTVVTAAGGLLLGAPAAEARPKIGEPAPAFQSVSFSGEKLTLQDLAGDVIILNFWATWCGPCRTELPLLAVYYEKRREFGLRVLAIATEDSVPSSFLKPLQAKMAMPLIKSFRGPYGPIDGAVPSNFIIDRAGVLRYAKAAALDLDDMNNILVPLLREAPPQAPTQTQTPT
jgi:cytochrome c biogenesis protein CcmG/thiol:disulfide interchange protein DsbE